LPEISQTAADDAVLPSAELRQRLRVAARSLFATFITGSIAVLPASAQTIKDRISACFGCHGENGQSQNPDIPSFGAQQPFYVTVQLVMFREGLRAYAPMNDAAKGLSDDDVRGIADFVAKLPPPAPAAGPADQDRIARARALAQQNHCDICHTSNFAGQQNVPRIADQRQDYLIKALRGYKDNSRHGYDATMAETMASVSDDQILDLAYYLSQMK
jgi:cytochrome c553